MLLCGHADFELAVDAVNTLALDHFVVKPFDGERDLLPIVTDLLDGWQGARDRDAEGVRIVGERDTSRGHTIQQFLGRNNIHYQWLDPSLDEGKTLLEAGRRAGPRPPANRRVPRRRRGRAAH